MVDVSDMLESEYVTKEFIKNSVSKKAVMLSAGVLSDNDYGKKQLTVLIEIDGRQKKYTPNRLSLRRMAEKWGNNSQAWIGKPFTLAVEQIDGREMITASPATF